MPRPRRRGRSCTTACSSRHSTIRPGREAATNSSRPTGSWGWPPARPAPGQLTLTGMASLERATTGPRGYRELFQTGETYHFIPIVDRQHPHDLLMQASVAWRLPLTDQNGPHVRRRAGRRAGSRSRRVHAPAVRRARTRWRRSATTRSIRRTFRWASSRSPSIEAPWVFETSVFQSGEPDDNRWDLVDFGAARFVVGPRVWYKPSDSWEVQGSHGYLKNPERLEFASIHRTTASAAWFKPGTNGFYGGDVCVRSGTTRSSTEPSTPRSPKRRGGRVVLRSSGVSKPLKSRRELLLTRDCSTLTPGAEGSGDGRHDRRRRRPAAVGDAWRFEGGVGADADLIHGPACLARRLWRSPAVLSGVSSDPSAGELDGPDVEHADGQADATLVT